jgi:hypothetical protein
MARVGSPANASGHCHHARLAHGHRSGWAESACRGLRQVLLQSGLELDGPDSGCTTNVENVHCASLNAGRTYDPRDLLGEIMHLAIALCLHNYLLLVAHSSSCNQSGKRMKHFSRFRSDAFRMLRQRRVIACADWCQFTACAVSALRSISIG